MLLSIAANMKLGFFASHGGSNMQAIIDACKTGVIAAVPAVVITNNKDSGAMKRAQNENIPVYHISAKTEGSEEKANLAIFAALEKHGVELIILAGYMKKIGTNILEKYSDRILNIHPALLPKYGGQGMYGKFVHDAVIKAGETETGVTIHLVNDEYDKGRIIAQAKVQVMPGDSAESLGERVLEAEHKLYVNTVRDVVLGHLKLN
jgi:phosphoribosylglycinamide formyltransferase-1